jgi:hypothetical protein
MSLRSVGVCALVLVGLAACEGEEDRPGPDGGVTHHDGAAPSEPCEVRAPTECSQPDLTYADVQPILERRCVSCHDGSADFWPLTEYGHVADWFIEVRAAMLTCSMPPPDAGLAMPASERETILQWIRCGHPR